MVLSFARRKARPAANSHRVQLRDPPPERDAAWTRDGFSAALGPGSLAAPTSWPYAWWSRTKAVR